MQNDIKQKIERFKIKAESFLENDIRAFIKDINNQFYFCDIIFVGDIYLVVQNFEGEKKGINSKLYWADVTLIEEYKEKNEVGR